MQTLEQSIDPHAVSSLLRSRRLLSTVLGLGIVVSLSAASSAATISAPLPGLVGVIDFDTPGGREFRVDLGREFAEIESVSIEVEARVTAEEFDVCGRVFEPAPCVHNINRLGLLVQLDDGLSGLAYSPGFDYYRGSSALEAQGVDSQALDTFFGWDFVLDGEFTASIFWNSFLGDPDRIIRNRIAPTGEILSAQIIIEGTPVPEPSTAVLIGLGLAILASPRQRDSVS